MFDAGLVRRGEPFRRKPPALSARAEGSDRDRRIGGPERRRAGLGYAAPGGVGQNRKRPDIRGLALIRGHALGRVAFHVFDRGIVFLRRQSHVFGRDVVLEIKERTALARNLPQGRDSSRCSSALGVARRGGFRPSAFNALTQRVIRLSGRPRIELPVGGARRDQPGTAPSAGTKLAISSFQTGRPPMWQVRCTAGFQPPDRARQSQAIVSSRAPCANVNFAQALAALGGDHLGAGESRVIGFDLGLCAAVDQRRHIDARCDQVAGGAMGIVVVAKNCNRRPAQRPSGSDRRAPPRPASRRGGRSLEMRSGRSMAPAARIARVATIRQKHSRAASVAAIPVKRTRSRAP